MEELRLVIDDAVQELRQQTLRYIAAREECERAMESAFTARREGRIGEISDIAETSYSELLSRYFDEKARSGANPVWQNPPTTSLAETEISAVTINGKRAVVSTRETRMNETRVYEYHFVARGPVWLLTDRRWIDDLDGRSVRRVY